MKTVALTVASPSLDGEVEAKFGRAEYLLLVDPGTMNYDPIENPGRNDGSGAGIRLAQLLSDRKVTDVIAGEFGPKASEALDLAGIRPHRCGPNVPAREAVALLKSGGLDGPNNTQGSGREEIGARRGGRGRGGGGQGRGLGGGRGRRGSGR